MLLEIAIKKTKLEIDTKKIKEYYHIANNARYANIGYAAYVIHTF